MLALFVFRADEVAGIHTHTILDHGSHNVRRQTLTIADDGVLRLLAEVVNQEHTIIDAPQLVEELVYAVE